jgi:hypothetical protein
MLRERSVERRLVWIFGSPRSGSTWLANLLARGGDVVMLDEPGIGAHLGCTPNALHGLRQEAPTPKRLEDLRRGAPDYFFSTEYEANWRPALRRLLIKRFAAQLGGARLAVIKEPHGSEGADILMSLLPESRFIFLLRDGRDVIDSELDAAQPGSWATRQVPGVVLGDRVDYVRERARLWLWRTETVQRAFAGHSPDLRWRVRYEDLVADAGQALRPVARWLHLDEEAVLKAASDIAFDRLPPDERGPGRFARAAAPGLWRENLTDDEKVAIEEIVGAKLRELGYE